MAGATSVGGLVSGIDIEGIITKLSDIEKKGVTTLENQKSILATRKSAYQAANTRLSALRDAASALSNATFFEARTATSSSPGSVAVSAQAGATPGQYQVTVGTLARTHQVVSQSYSDINATRLGTGTFTVTANGTATTITLDETNNTLGGLRDALNRAGTNIRAAIVQDGDSSYRLMVSSKETGTVNALTLSTSLSGGAEPTFNDLQSARDASVTLGSGVNAITVTRSTNAVRDLIPGVTMNLVAGSEGQSVTVDVGLDTTSIQQGVQKFIDQYNNALEFMNAQFKYNADAGTAGALLGDYTLQGIQQEVVGIISGVVSGTAGTSSLADIGIRTTGDGKLALDAGKFQDKLSADPDAVARLFALTGSASNASVQFLGAGAKTVASGAAYAVEITQVARQARVSAGAAMSGPLAADETLTINNVSVALTAGMTRDQVIAAINARSKDTRVQVSATGADGTGSGDFLTFRANAYGSTAPLSIVSSVSNADGDSTGIGTVAATAADPSGEAGSGTGETGLDVVGTINGEAATGNGQVLTGTTSNTTTAGLRLRITALAPGSLGTVQVFGGAAHTSTQALSRITDAINGPIKTETDSLDARIDDLAKTITTRGEGIDRYIANLRAKFNNMETLMGKLQSQSSFLTSQFAAMNKSSSSG
jgi:flagellar hook-associated protein 2